LITFGICGIWHGASWTYLFFGLAQGIAMSAELITRRIRNRQLKRLPSRSVKIAGWSWAMGVFVLSEVFFRASDLDDAWMVYGRLFHPSGIGDAQDLFAHKGPFDFVMYFAVIGLWFAVARAFRRVSISATPWFVLLCASLVLFLGHLGNGRFIYAGF
jgi:D-alanyl-lipoteichoic acid acyltransferase DltB (MBOAT superfamily)